MIRTIIIALLCLVAVAASAQHIIHRFDNVSMPQALLLLNKMQQDYTISFIYDELEDFKVTKTVNAKNVPDAIRQLIGFYPIKLTQDGKHLFVECTHKTARRYIGRVVDSKGLPLEYATVMLLSPRDSTLITSGVSNENGNFVIPADVDRALLRVSYIGFKTIYKPVTVGNVGTLRMQVEYSKVLKGDVMVTAQNHQAVDHGVAYYPTPDNRRHASNYLELLGQMMVAGLRVDVFDNKVETAWGGSVHFFVDGQEAQDWQVKALRPREVARIEYLLSPPEPQYKNYQAVINFVLRQYDYGGYVYIDGSQSVMNNTGDYNVATKVKTGKTTIQAAAGTMYHDVDDITRNQTTTYVYDDSETVTKDERAKGERKLQEYFGAVSARYDDKNVTLTLDGGVQYTHRPTNVTTSDITYTTTDAVTTSRSASEYAENNLVPYVNGSFQFNELPRKSVLYGGFSFSYNRNKQDTRYMLESEDLTVLNAYRERAYLPSFYLGYQMPVYKQNSLRLLASANLEMYRTHYSGTDNSRQTLNNHYYLLSAQYSHRFSDNWNATAALNVPIQSFNVNGGSWTTTPYVNGKVTVNGKLGTKHSFYAYFNIAQSEITPSYYNTVYRQDSELEASRGNADLKTMRQAFAVLSYTWMPSNTFTLNASAKWDNIINDIVPWWHPVDGMMVCEMVNSGDFNPIYLTVTPSVTLFDGKLRISSMVTYIHEWHNGLFHVNSGYLGFFPYVTYRFNNHFSTTLNYAMCTGKGYMRGTSEMGDSDNNRLHLQLQYTTGNLFVKLRANHLLSRYGGWKTWLDSDHIHQYCYSSPAWDGMYFTLSASYTFNFGKKSIDRDNLQFNGTTKSSAL